MSAVGVRVVSVVARAVWPCERKIPVVEDIIIIMDDGVSDTVEAVEALPETAVPSGMGPAWMFEVRRERLSPEES